MLKKIIENIKAPSSYVSTMTNKIEYSILMLLANAFLTRYLGVDFKGTYGWISTVSYIIAAIGGLGIYHSIAYNKRNGLVNVEQIYVNIFMLQLIVYLMLSALICLIFRSQAVILIAVLSVFDMTSQQFSMLILITNLKERNRILVRGALLNLLLSIFAFLVLPTSIEIGVGIVVLVKVYYIYTCQIKSRTTLHPFQVKLADVAAKIKFGFVPMLSFLLLTLNYRIDVLMLEGFKSVSPQDLSFYTAAVSIAEIAWFIPDVFKDVLFSKTARDNAYEDIVSAIRISNLLLFFLAIFMMGFGKWIILILFGTEFLPAHNLTVLLFCGIPAMSWFKITSTLFTAQGRTRSGFVILLISVLINVALNIILIPIHSSMGAAIATICSYCVCGVIFLFRFSKETHTPIYRLILPKLRDFKVILKKR